MRKSGSAAPNAPLSEEKIARVKEIAMREFGEKGYLNASTNTITRGAGISKGSLFNLFGSKKELYFELVEDANDAFVSKLLGVIDGMPTDYLERLTRIADIYLDFYVESPAEFRFLMTMTDPANREIAMEFARRYEPKSMEIQAKLYAGIDTSALDVPPERIAKITNWIMTEIKNDVFMNPLARQDPAAFKKHFMGELDEMLRILKHGMYSRSE